MSYINPENTSISTIGIDATITTLQSALGDITWLTKCFHRAYRHYEIQGKKTLSIPKTWEANNEWYNNLPNDNLPAQAFFYPIGDEQVLDFDQHIDPLWQQKVCLIVWVNTNKLSGHTTGPSLAQEKADVLAILNNSDLVISVDSVVDRSADDIFEPFTIDDPKNHFTMLPFAGFRINFTVKFDYIVCNSPSS
jgi:hypothetical protein